MIDLNALIGLFFANRSLLGDFVMIDTEALPDAPRKLLAHNRHMTAVVGAFHRSTVALEVLESVADGDFYWRNILLRRTNDSQAVLFAIVRLDFRCFNGEVRAEIERRAIPLGRILVEYGISCAVSLDALWQIRPAAELQQHLALTSPATIYGRTALICCDRVPAIELLEIVAPT